MTRLPSQLRRWKAALQMLLLAFVLATPGFASTACAYCQQDERPAMTTAHGKSSTADCREQMAQAAVPRDDTGKGAKHAMPPCCAMGVSCAVAVALPVALAEPPAFALSSLLVGTPVTAYPSRTLIPDHPPPRA